jgi:hypothetical protein
MKLGLSELSALPFQQQSGSEVVPPIILQFKVRKQETLV